MNNPCTLGFIKIVAMDLKNYKITIEKLRKFAFIYVFCKTVRQIATNRRFFANFYCTILIHSLFIRLKRRVDATIPTV